MIFVGGRRRGHILVIGTPAGSPPLVFSFVSRGGMVKIPLTDGDFLTGLYLRYMDLRRDDILTTRSETAKGPEEEGDEGEESWPVPHPTFWLKVTHVPLCIEGT